VLLPILLAALLLTGNRAQTLGSELANRGLPAPADAADLEREITSYHVDDGADWFVIAYYLVEPDGLLHDLQVRAFDKRAGAWAHGRTQGIGSVLRIQRGAGWLYVSGHSSPSAAPTVVLDQNLRVRNKFDGWLELVLADGRVVFQRSMTHFQPAHAALLAIFDPGTGRGRTFYPAAGAANIRGLEWVSKKRHVAVDRTLSEFQTVPPSYIQFNVATQAVVVIPDGARPIDVPRRFRVVCNVAAAVPTCVDQPATAPLVPHFGQNGKNTLRRISQPPQRSNNFKPQWTQ
jgi:hypothetical protein